MKSNSELSQQEAILQQVSNSVKPKRLLTSFFVVLLVSVTTVSVIYLFRGRTGKTTFPSKSTNSSQYSMINLSITLHPSIASPYTSLEAKKWKTYTNSEWRIQYPANMIIRAYQMPSLINSDEMITLINLQGFNSEINIKTEINSGNQSIEKWLSQRVKDEREGCRLDCFGFSSPYESIKISDRIGIIQYLGNVIGTVNIYLPLNEGAIIWASGSTEKQLNPSLETRDLLISILKTLSIH